MSSQARQIIAQFVSGFALLTAVVFVAALVSGVPLKDILGWVSLSAYSQPHWPDLSVLARSSLQIQIHVAAAMGAFVIGLLQFIGPKGATVHRVLGWSWCVLMLITAISSFWIVGLNGKMYSPIHGLSALTVIAVPGVIAAARRHDIKAHKKAVYGLFIGALMIAGLFTLLPGRLMWHVFFN